MGKIRKKLRSIADFLLIFFKLFWRILPFLAIYIRFWLSFKLAVIKFRLSLRSSRIPKDLRKDLVRKYSDFAKENFKLGSLLKASSGLFRTSRKSEK